MSLFLKTPQKVNMKTSFNIQQEDKQEQNKQQQTSNIYGLSHQKVKQMYNMQKSNGTDSEPELAQSRNLSQFNPKRNSRDQSQLLNDFFSNKNVKQNSVSNSGRKIKRYVLAQNLYQYESKHNQDNILNSNNNNLTPQYISSKNNLGFNNTGSNFNIELNESKFTETNLNKNNDLQQQQSQQLINNQEIVENEKEKIKKNNIFNELKIPLRQKYTEYNQGPRYDNKQQLVPYSIIGNSQWFIKKEQEKQKRNKYKKAQPNFQNKNYKNQNTEQMEYGYDELDEDDNSETEDYSEQGSPIRKMGIITQGFGLNPYNQSEREKEMQNHRLKKKQQSRFANKIENQSHIFDDKRNSMGQIQKNHSQVVNPVQTIKHFHKKHKHKNPKQEFVTKQELIEKLKEQHKNTENVNNQQNKVVQQQSIQDRNMFTREERVLKKHEAVSQNWDNQIRCLSVKNKRNPENLLLYQSEAYRQKVEEQEALEIVKTQAERFGTSIWYMNLRYYEKDEVKYIKKENEKDLEKNKYNGQVLKKHKLERVYPDIHTGFNTLITYQPKQEIEVIKKPSTSQSLYNTGTQGFQSTNSTQNGTHRRWNSSAGFSTISSMNHATLVNNKLYKTQSQKQLDKLVVLDSEIDDLTIQGINKYQSELTNLINDGNNLQTQYKRFKPVEEEIKEKKIEKLKQEFQISQAKFNINTVNSIGDQPQTTFKDQELQKLREKRRQMDFNNQETQPEVYQQKENAYENCRRGKYFVKKIQKQMEDVVIKNIDEQNQEIENNIIQQVSQDQNQ